MLIALLSPPGSREPRLERFPEAARPPGRGSRVHHRRDPRAADPTLPRDPRSPPIPAPGAASGRTSHLRGPRGQRQRAARVCTAGPGSSPSSARLTPYKALVSLVLGIFLLGEMPTALGVTGMLLILAGSFFVWTRGSGPAGTRSRTSSGYLACGFGLRHSPSADRGRLPQSALLFSSPLTTFLLWSILGLPIAPPQ